MTENGWKKLEIVGNGLNWLTMAESGLNGWKWQNMDGNGCKD